MIKIFAFFSAYPSRSQSTRRSQKSQRRPARQTSRSSVLWLKEVSATIDEALVLNNILYINCVRMIRYLHFTHRLFCTAAATNRIYGVPSQMGGKSSEGLYERYSTFSNKDLSTFKMRLMQTDRFDKEGECALPGINIVNTPEECRHCLHILMRNPSAVVAWDT